MTILLLFGGGGTEHEISRLSAEFIRENLPAEASIFFIELLADGSLLEVSSQKQVELTWQKTLRFSDKEIPLNYAIPCIHGPPGETGEIQAFFDLIKLPYLGSGTEASGLCFNKVSTKLWMDAFGIPNVPFLSLTGEYQLESALEFFNQHPDLFMKASHQGSSVGCYHVSSEQELKKYLPEAFKLSPFVLLEKTIKGRELEVAVYEYQGKLHATPPGEIVCPTGFYDYAEKYNEQSQTQTLTEAPNLSPDLLEQINNLSLKTFKLFKLKDLARIDFFLEGDQLFINEVNTFPGFTSISMFPQMLQNQGLMMTNFFQDRLGSI